MILTRASSLLEFATNLANVAPGPRTSNLVEGVDVPIPTLSALPSEKRLVPSLSDSTLKS